MVNSGGGFGWLGGKGGRRSKKEGKGDLRKQGRILVVLGQ